MKSLICSLVILFFFNQIGVKAGVTQDINEYGSLYFEKSREWLNYGILKKAEDDITTAIKNFPDNPSADKAVLLKAEIYLTGKNYILADGMLAEFTKARNNSPFLAPANLLRSFIALEQKDYPKAASLLEHTTFIAEAEYLSREDTLYSIIAHISTYWHGISLAHQGKYQEAEPIFLAAVRKYPHGQFADDALYALGQSAEINRKFEEAIEYYTEIQKKYTYSNNYLSSLIREANNRLILRQAAAAIASLERAGITIERIDAKDSIGLLYEIQSHCDNVVEEMLYLRGEANNLAGNFDRAVIIFKSFLETFDNSTLTNSVRLGLAWALLNQDDAYTAIQYYDDIIADPKELPEDSRIRAIAKLFRTVALKMKGDIEQAQRELSALSVQPDYPFLGLALLELGQLYYEAEDYEQARRTLERAERESAHGMTSVKIHLLLAGTYMELKKWESAINEYDAAIQLARSSSDVFLPGKNKYLAEARLKQGIAFIMTHRSAEAIPILITYLGETTSHFRIDEGLFWLAEAYYRAEMFTSATETFNRLITNYPSTPRREEALYSLGWSHLRMKDFKNSSTAFDRLLNDFPNTEFGPEVLSRQGDGYFYTKNFRAAADAYERAKRLAPNTENGQYSAYQLCHALYRIGDYEKSITALMDFVKRYPRSNYAPNALYLIGWIRFQQKSYNEAMDNFRFLINSYPQSDLIPRTYYAIGDALYNKGEYEKAIETYKVVIETFPSSDLAPEAMKSIQYCLMALGREDEAISDIDAYISANPTSPFATDFQFKKAELIYTGRKYKDAVTEYESIIQKSPDSERNAEALYWMLKSYINLIDVENTDKTFARLKTKFPKSEFTPLGLLEMALFKKRSNDISQAENLFVELQQKFPEHPTAAQAGFERATIKYNLGDTAAAMNLFRDIADRYPNQEYGGQSRWKIAMYLRSVSLFDSSRKEFAVLAANDYDRLLAAESQYSIGELWMRDKQYEKAIEAFNIVRDKFVGIEDWYSLALLNIGECYENTSKYYEAREVYMTLESLRPDDDFGKTAKRRLKRVPKE